jgi:PAS domain S-box-containing protein
MTNDSTDIEIIAALRQQLAEKEKENVDLRENLDQFRHASEGANDGLWDWNLTQAEPSVSTPWKTMLGFKPAEEVNINDLWEKILHPEDKHQALKEFKDFVAGKNTSYDSVFRLLHTDGTYRWIRSTANAKFDDNGVAYRVSGAHVDITEQKNALDALSKSKEKYKALFQNSLVAIFRSRIDTGEMIEYNSKVLELFGIEDDNNLATLDYYNNPEDREWIIQELKEKGAINQRELQLKRADGALIWVSFSSVAYPEENTIECVLIDITQSKLDTIELQKVNFELDSFVYHSSHDLRSPLRSILGLINIYRHETDEYLKDEYIDRIERSIYKLDHLVQELLSISRNDRVNDPLTEINFMQEIDYSVDGYYNALDTDNLSFVTKIKQPVRFVSDLTRVKILLNNIISNAIKYRDLDKELSLVTADIVVDEDKAIVKIIDNGEGIPKEQIPLIFDMFHRASDHSDGSGLGLYIVKNVANKLNAEIIVTSEPYVETVFTITIPNAFTKK